VKRSEINRIIRNASLFLQERQFHLPPFAFWTPEEWCTKGSEVSEIVRSQLGWDITDFGSGRFDECGLFLFTLRNGTPDNLRTMTGKLYAEKILIVRENQITPFHFHFQKMEDIINRGGGVLLVQVFNATPEGNDLADTNVTVSLDGVVHQVKAGETLALKPGESITLPTRLYHKFWGAPGEGTVLVGEVSVVNDDDADNRFLEEIGRFPAIEEDEAPLHLLVSDYDQYYRPETS
jgi:D-lyxose ketol-isomerase